MGVRGLEWFTFRGVEFHSSGVQEMENHKSPTSRCSEKYTPLMAAGYLI